MSVLSSLIVFIKSSLMEISKISWPSKKEVYAHASIVFLMMFVFMVFFFFVDLLLSKFVAFLLD
ncbi:preprotein translocase subunit SecE [Candidatus Gromoviella agglomerans]|uniref:preprotein translocase subunit SecE n=1 Tax=Candidatus Gromoviella agglomerans TaxID=2806609 RepID=UPI003B75D206|nr:Protein translocase subunit SecE [Candidatus Gromoviella agglomerans]